MAKKDLMNCCLYLRYSDHTQSEQSIEGQMRVCKDFCQSKGYRIVEIYIDRATTARKDVDKRLEFQRMIRDSEKHLFEAAIVYKLDRFARNRYDSATFKARLKKNGVKVISATENITDNPEGIILEAVLEGMAEFYSAELSQKITRGMRESALKCNSTGGHVPMGYKIENKKLVVNPATAHIVQEAFALYAGGETIATICQIFNDNGYRTTKNVPFGRNSFKSMFRNERYIGIYKYRDMRIEGGIPSIIEKELYEKVQDRLSTNGEAPARGKAKVDYLLSGKLFCGHCGGSMNGESGTGRHGQTFHYYTCYSRKRNRSCDKKSLTKDFIERAVVQDSMLLLTDKYINELADMAVSQTETDLRENTIILTLTTEKNALEASIVNIMKAVENGTISDTLLNRLTELEAQKKDIEKQITREQKDIFLIEKPVVVYWLNRFKNGNIEDEGFRKNVINLLVNSVTVWDEPDGFKITSAYNLTSYKTKTFRVSKDIGSSLQSGSDLKRQSPPFYLEYELHLRGSYSFFASKSNLNQGMELTTKATYSTVYSRSTITISR